MSTFKEEFEVEVTSTSKSRAIPPSDRLVAPVDAYDSWSDWIDGTSESQQASESTLGLNSLGSDEE